MKVRIALLLTLGGLAAAAIIATGHVARHLWWKTDASGKVIYYWGE